MKTLRMFYVVLIALLGFAKSGFTEIVNWQPCSNPDGDMKVSCIVHEVNVHPCREASRGEPCRIKKGRSASISFDFTPEFSGEDLVTRAYWPTQGMDFGFVGMNTNACESTICPVSTGTRQTYNYTLPIDRNFQSRVYEVKWKLWNPENEGCCFRFQIRLTR